MYTPNAHTVVIALDNGESYDAVLQDIQFHPVTDKILHIDFYRLYEDKEIAMDIPVRLHGNARGVLNGGVLRRNRRKLRVKALPANLPDFIDADITKMKIGHKLYVTDLENEKYRFLHTDNTVVCQVKTARTAVADLDDEDEELEEGAEAAAATEGGDAPAEAPAADAAPAEGQE